MAFQKTSIFDDIHLFESTLEVIEEYQYDKFPEDCLINLAKLIDNLAQDSIFGFLEKIKETISLGKKVNGLHPLNTFEHILLNEKCKKQIQFIFDENHCTTTIWNPNGWIFAKIRNHFTQGLCHVLKKRSEKNEITAHLDVFCEKIKIEKGKLLPFIEKENWLDFVRIILLKS